MSRDFEGTDAVVVADGEGLAAEQCRRNLVEVAFGGGGVERSVAVVVTGAKKVAGQRGARNGGELTGLGGGMDDGVAAFAGDGERLVDEMFGGDVIQVAGEGGGVEHGVAGGGAGEERLAGEEGAWNLGQVAVEGGGVERGFAGVVDEAEGGDVEEHRWQVVEMSGLGRLMEQGVAEVGADGEQLGCEDRVGEHAEPAVRRGDVVDRKSGVAGLREQVVHQKARRQLGGGRRRFEGVMQGSVAGLVLGREGLRLEQVGRHDGEASVAGGEMEGGVARRVRREPEAMIRERRGRRDILTGAKGDVESGGVHGSEGREALGRGGGRQGRAGKANYPTGNGLRGDEENSESSRMTQVNPAVNDDGKKDAVLVVDDEAPLLEMYRTALSAHFEVTTASSVREAEFALHKKAFRVVVADHLMPGGNGLSFLVRVREEHPEAARVLVTGYMKPEMLLRAVNEAAVFRYLVKPVELREFVSVVKEAAKSVAAAGG